MCVSIANTVFKIKSLLMHLDTFSYISLRHFSRQELLRHFSRQEHLPHSLLLLVMKRLCVSIANAVCKIKSLPILKTPFLIPH